MSADRKPSRRSMFMAFADPARCEQFLQTVELGVGQKCWGRDGCHGGNSSGLFACSHALTCANSAAALFTHSFMVESGTRSPE